MTAGRPRYLGLGENLICASFLGLSVTLKQEKLFPLFESELLYDCPSSVGRGLFGRVGFSARVYTVMSGFPKQNEEKKKKPLKEKQGVQERNDVEGEQQNRQGNPLKKEACVKMIKNFV